MPFSWAQTLIDAVKIKQEHAIRLAKGGNPDFKIRHPDEVRDANNKDYTKLIVLSFLLLVVLLLYLYQMFVNQIF